MQGGEAIPAARTFQAPRLLTRPKRRHRCPDPSRSVVAPGHLRHPLPLARPASIRGPESPPTAVKQVVPRGSSWEPCPPSTESKPPLRTPERIAVRRDDAAPCSALVGHRFWSAGAHRSTQGQCLKRAPSATTSSADEASELRRRQADGAPLSVPAPLPGRRRTSPRPHVRPRR